MYVDRSDHFVLTVRDVETTCAFYTRVLGMEVVTNPAGRKALRFGREKINLHPAGNEYQPSASVPTPGSADFCLITSLPLTQVAGHLRSCGVEIVWGPVVRMGATSALASLYFYDPDGNLVEVANDLEDLI